MEGAAGCKASHGALQHFQRVWEHFHPLLKQEVVYGGIKQLFSCQKHTMFSCITLHSDKLGTSKNPTLSVKLTIHRLKRNQTEIKATKGKRKGCSCLLVVLAHQYKSIVLSKYRIVGLE